MMTNDHYTAAQGWFTVDFVSCIPLNYMEYLYADELAAPVGDDQRANKFARLLKIARLAKLLKSEFATPALLSCSFFSCGSRAPTPSFQLRSAAAGPGEAAAGPMGGRPVLSGHVQDGQAAHHRLRHRTLAGVRLVLFWRLSRRQHGRGGLPADRLVRAAALYLEFSTSDCFVNAMLGVWRC